ncbi:rhodanese-like domain-containing protein [Nitriliruptor alkaliphilus]|uniref:rhodanese-like domain-containing protein n=1 Tax=Nitriliruptor alkaliphilus TaxID=427918 RepID=UPI000698B846|nr:rhodanese-like domain-containing protein [Nitriliruptor alkaliphilus]
MRRLTLTTMAMAAFGALLAGCGTSNPDAASATGSDAATVEAVAAQADGRVVIDVRTPEEFDAGHVDGALLIDVQQPDFEARVSELPLDEAYFVYCRTGNRSGQAIERMRELGFTDLVNGGGFDELAEAGLDTSTS